MVLLPIEVEKVVSISALFVVGDGTEVQFLVDSEEFCSDFQSYVEYHIIRWYFMFFK